MQYLLWHCIDDWAQRTPDAAAVICGSESLSYADLAERTDSLAALLANLGVRRGDRVGVMLRKGLETQVAVHGVLKAGGVLVPLDPAAPAGRIRFILDDCDIKVVVSQAASRRALARALAGATSVRALVGPDPSPELPETTVPWSRLERAPRPANDGDASELDLAYIMYTSGTTGQPKGLMHTHYSGLSYARLATWTYGLRPADRVSGFAPLYVDQCTLACFGAPVAGACAVMIPDEIAGFAIDLAEAIANSGITVWYSVPLPLIQLAERGELDQFDHRALRWVTYGGEPFPPKHLRTLMRHWSQARFSNVYGPAEVNQCTYHHFTAGDLSDETNVPIGRAWANTEALLIDDRSEVLDGEATGELLIRSPTMMHGYWRRPDLDERAFVDLEPHPNFRTRYYRTGDLVHRRPDGVLEFLGRMDRQVKMRGYRVELDEVEAALCTHPSVVEAAALTVGDSPSDRRILAAVLLSEGECVEDRALVKHVAARLPPYAVPESVTVEQTFPRTGGGKVDRRALAARLDN